MHKYRALELRLRGPRNPHPIEVINVECSPGLRSYVNDDGISP
ncbi:hypothetical protein ACVILK_002018 [Bradyrhizobium embrapense]